MCIPVYNNNYEANFTLSFLPPSRNPTDPKGKNFKVPYMPCLGDFGGFVDPNVALGGFGRKSGGILTIL